MTRTELASVDPVKVLAAVLHTLPRDAKGRHYINDCEVGTGSAGWLLAAMPDHTIVRRADLEALQAVAEAARALADFLPHPGGAPESNEDRQWRLEDALEAALARLNPEPEK